MKAVSFSGHYAKPILGGHHPAHHGKRFGHFDDPGSYDGGADPLHPDPQHDVFAHQDHTGLSGDTGSLWGDGNGIVWNQQHNALPGDLDDVIPGLVIGTTNAWFKPDEWTTAHADHDQPADNDATQTGPRCGPHTHGPTCSHGPLIPVPGEPSEGKPAVPFIVTIPYDLTPASGSASRSATSRVTVSPWTITGDTGSAGGVKLSPKDRADIAAASAEVGRLLTQDLDSAPHVARAEAAQKKLDKVERELRRFAKEGSTFWGRTKQIFRNIIQFFKRLLGFGRQKSA